MKKITYLICMAGMIFQSCNPKATQDNPFFQDFGTPYEVPSFQLIRNHHYLPAFKEGIRQQQAEIEAITGNAEAPTFANTVEALEKSGQLLNKVSAVFFNLKEANTNDSLQLIAEEATPLLSAHNDNINLNRKLFERIKTVYENRHQENLTTEQQRVLDKYYKGFVRGGADLSAEDQEKLKKINGELSMLALKFGNNLLKETNNYQLVIENEKELSGLPAGIVSTAAEAAKEAGMEGKWLFTLHNPSIMPFLQYADNRELREQIYKAYINRGNRNNEYDNKAVISKMLALRLEKARLLGFPDYASYVLDENMAKNPENVYKLCNQIWEAALPVAQKEAQALQKMVYQTGGKFKLQPWDWRYYAEKVKQADYGLDENELRQYFPLEKVREGAFYTANKLYGITFTPRTDFSHIFDGGYSAGYYAYTWAEVLDADAFEAFKETGDIFNPEKAEAFHHLLAKGGSEEAMKLYSDFRGKEPSIEPLLKRRGLK